MNLNIEVRQKMINRLVQDDIQTIRQCMENDDIEYLDTVLRNGIGYDKMTDKGIVEEFFSRTWEDKHETV